MSTPDAAESAQATQGTTKAGGQPDGEPNAKGGQPDGAAQQGQDFEKDYKELQSKFSKVTDELKDVKGSQSKFEKYGGADKLIDQVEALLGDDEFNEWAKQRQQKNEYGINPNDTDAETKNALQLVEKIAQSTTDRTVKQAVAELKEEIMGSIDPVSSSVATETMDRLLDGLDEKYGDSWREVKDEMADIIEADKSFPKIPTAKAVEGALVQALLNAGKMEAFGEKLYKQSLEAKKDMATETLGTRPDATTDKKPQTVREAYRMAKQQHGG
jgi:hypothetical protein